MRAEYTPEIPFLWAGPESLLEAIVATADRRGVHYGDPGLLRYLFWDDPPSRDATAEALSILVERGDLRIEDGPEETYSSRPLVVCRILRRARFERFRNRQGFSAAQRGRIYARDGHRCRSCGSSRDLSIDHIHPFSKGGCDEDWNLQTLCRPCNSRKGNR